MLLDIQVFTRNNNPLITPHRLILPWKIAILPTALYVHQDLRLFHYYVFWRLIVVIKINTEESL